MGTASNGLRMNIHSDVNQSTDIEIQDQKKKLVQSQDYGQRAVAWELK